MNIYQGKAVGKKEEWVERGKEREIVSGFPDKLKHVASFQEFCKWSPNTSIWYSEHL